MNRCWRLVCAVAAAAAFGSAAPLVVAAPAAANSVFVWGLGSCDPSTGEFAVTWSVVNDADTDATVVDADPPVGQLAPGAVIPRRTEGNVLTDVQRVPGTATS